MIQEERTKAKAYTQQQLVKLYRVSWKVFKAWTEPFAEEIGELKGKCYTPKQVQTIFNRIGEP